MEEQKEMTKEMEEPKEMEENTSSFLINNASLSSTLIDDKKKKKKGCQFPSAYTILLGIEFVIFLLTYIIPKGLFWKLEYSSQRNVFVITVQNGTTFDKNATQETLNYYNIKIPIDSFKDGLITKPVSIPNTYNRTSDENLNFFRFFLYPVLGFKDSVDIAIFLFVLGGIINILVEMNAISAGMSALSRASKGREFLLIILVFVIITIGGSIIGLMEEILAFFPILMPIFLQNGIDPILGTASIYMGSMMGNMFSITNPFTVMVGSYSCGIPFVDGIVFRIISYILGVSFTVGFFYLYHRKTQADEKASVVYDIKKSLEEKYLKDEKDNTAKKENADNIDEENLLLNKEKEEKETKDKEKEEIASDKFTCKQKIALIIFGGSFAFMVFGVVTLDWMFDSISSMFAVVSIILLFILWKGEYKGIEIFVKGAGDFVGVAIVVGIARGINITLDEGKISDTILYSFSNLISDLPKILFTVIMLIIYMLLGILIYSSTGLATLTLPIFAPLADNVSCQRKIMVNTFMMGQYFSGIITPAGLLLIALQMVGIPYNYWIKFIWPFLVALFILLVIIIIFDTLIEG